MSIRLISFSGIRNLIDTEIEPSQNLNLIYGDNGSGKSSFLESISILSTGKSYRAKKLAHCFSYKTDKMLIKAVIEDKVLGKAHIENFRMLESQQIMKINDVPVGTQAEVAHWLPIQQIDPTAFSLLSGAPEKRREFMDWGLFHVEQSFFPKWKLLRQQLKQRNVILKNKDKEFLQQWTSSFCLTSEQINESRKKYLQEFKPIFLKMCESLGIGDDLSLKFHQGWDENKSLQEILLRQEERDLQLGYTQSGPHRAEMKLKSQGFAASEVLSRGQQKLTVLALKLAQSELFYKQSGRKSIYLIDDLSSELDEKHMSLLFQYFAQLNCQIFITSIKKEDLIKNAQTDKTKLFHVEQGIIKQET